MIGRHKRSGHSYDLGLANALAASSLTIDESGATQAYSFTVTDGGDAFNIAVKGQSDGQTKTYSDIDDLTVVGSIFNDTFAVNAAPLADGATLTLDGLGGTDSLALDLRALAVNLQRADDGTVSGSGLSFKGFETVALTLGAGVNSVATGDSADTIDARAGGTDTIATGAGDDTIAISITGAHAIDGGDGRDFLSVDLFGRGTFTALLDVDQHTVVNSTYQSIEKFDFKVTGQLVVTMVLRGDFEANPVSVTFTGKGTGSAATIDFDGSSFTHKMIVDAGTPTYENNTPSDYTMIIEGGATHGGFGLIDHSHVVGSALADDFSFVGPPPIRSWTVDWNGGDGIDTLTFDLQDPADYVFLYNNLRFVPHADGTIESTYGTFANFERFIIHSGTGSYIVGGGLDDELTGRSGIFYGKDGNDKLVGTYVDGGAGNDDLTGATAAYDDATSGVTVRIAAGAQDTIGAGVDTFHGIVNLVGSDFADTLTGDAAANTIEGAGGNDLLAGGGGIDTLSYAHATARVVASLATTNAQDTLGAGVDTVSGFENLTGSAFDDVLGGDAGNNIIDGGDGNDRVSYAAATGAVSVDLRLTGVQNTGDGADTLVGIEGVIGSAFGDTLTGDFHDNTIEGGAGDDVLDGTTGFDIASYFGAAAGVTVDLRLIGVQQETGGSGRDTLANFEGLTGSAFADVLIGDGADNRLFGGVGDDVLTGGNGSDEIRGGDGIDTAVYQAGDWTRYTVAEAGSGNYTVTNTLTGDVDLLLAMERVRFSNGTFTLAEAVNAAPRARADKVAGLIEQGDGVLGQDHAAGDVLANDRDANLKTPGLGETLAVTGIAFGRDPASFTSVAGERTVEGKYGTLTIRGDGSFDYLLDDARPATDNLGPGRTVNDVFTYQLKDAHGLAATATLSLAIAGSDGAAPIHTPTFEPAFHPHPVETQDWHPMPLALA